MGKKATIELTNEELSLLIDLLLYASEEYGSLVDSTALKMTLSPFSRDDIDYLKDRLDDSNVAND